MPRIKNHVKAIGVSLFLGTLVLGFQNCAPNEMESMTFSSMSGSGSILDSLPFPSDTHAVVINPGTKITLKINRPAFAAGDNGWVVVTDHFLLKPNFDEAVPSLDRRYLLLPIETAPTSSGSVALPKTLSLEIFQGWDSNKYTTNVPGAEHPGPQGVQLGNGSINIQISNGTAYPSDFTNELCIIRPTHRFCSP